MLFSSDDFGISRKFPNELFLLMQNQCVELFAFYDFLDDNSILFVAFSSKSVISSNVFKNFLEVLKICKRRVDVVLQITTKINKITHLFAFLKFNTLRFRVGRYLYNRNQIKQVKYVLLTCKFILFNTHSLQQLITISYSLRSNFLERL